MRRNANGRPRGQGTAMPPASPFGLPILAGHSFRHAIPEGSRVLTPDGSVAVETLAPGDPVVAGHCGVAWIRDVVRIAVAPETPLVLLPAHVLGRCRPERDLTLPAHQPLIVRGWRAAAIFGAEEARVSVSRLIDERLVRLVPASSAAFWSLVLDTPTVLHVDGIEVMSAARSAFGSG